VFYYQHKAYKLANAMKQLLCINFHSTFFLTASTSGLRAKIIPTKKLQSDKIYDIIQTVEQP
jgi:hypothetical protein